MCELVQDLQLLGTVESLNSHGTALPLFFPTLRNPSLLKERSLG